MRLRVGTLCALVYDGREYHGGEEFEVPDDAAPNWLRTRLVVPAFDDDVWPDGDSRKGDRHTE